MCRDGEREGGGRTGDKGGGVLGRSEGWGWWGGGGWGVGVGVEGRDFRGWVVGRIRGVGGAETGQDGVGGE